MTQYGYDLGAGAGTIPTEAELAQMGDFDTGQRISQLLYPRVRAAPAPEVGAEAGAEAGTEAGAGAGADAGLEEAGLTLDSIGLPEIGAVLAIAGIATTIGESIKDLFESTPEKLVANTIQQFGF